MRQEVQSDSSFFLAMAAAMDGYRGGHPLYTFYCDFFIVVIFYCDFFILFYLPREPSIMKEGMDVGVLVRSFLFYIFLLHFFTFYYTFSFLFYFVFMLLLHCLETRLGQVTIWLAGVDIFFLAQYYIIYGYVWQY